MIVKLGRIFSTPREVKGGLPQGSLQGVMLFDLRNDDFELSSADVKRPKVVVGDNPDCDALWSLDPLLPEMR